MTAEGGASTFPTHAIFNVLLSQERVFGGEPPVIPAEDFRDKIVFVGTSATGLADIHATAFGGRTPGVFLQATLAENILSREFIQRAPDEAALALTFGGGLSAGLAAVTLPAWASLVVVIALGLAWISLATLWVGAGTWAPVVGPVLAAVIALVGGLAWQYFVEGREKRQIKRLFGRYVSPAIFQQLISNPSVARLGGERREMSVIFSDIRGFTSASEHGEPEAIVAQLNEYFSAMVDVLFEHHGTLDKFVGDQVMGLFGAPVADDHHADHAVAAALGMSDRLDRLNARWAAEGRRELQIGIGINTGEMIAGNIGSEAIMSYTVIGDAVNLGARLESLNKEHGTRILMSAATKARLTTAVRSRLVGTVQVKGRHEPVTVHEVLAPEGTGAQA
jgi:adenylate cyclase